MNIIPELKEAHMPVQLKEVKTLKELRTFIKFPQKLYKKNPNWVPNLFFDEYNTLRWDKNPAFEHSETKYWLAYKDGKLAGRVAAILNHLHKEKWGQEYMRFGWIDFIDDPEVSQALMDAVESWAKEKGLKAVHGPLGFTDLDPEGMLIEGFDELGTLVGIYNAPYYLEHMQRMGYIKDIDWVEYEISAPPQPNEKIARAAEIVMKRNNLKLLKVKRKKELLELNYANKLFELLDEEYSILYGTVPLTKKQMDFYVEQYFGFVNPDFIPIILDENDNMVAFGICMPSFSRALQKSLGQLFPFGFIHFLKALNTYERMDLYLIAVKSEYQGKGVNAVLMDQMSKVFLKHGVKKIESNPELENNQNVQGQWKYYETRQHKRRRCFIKHLEA